MRIPLSWLLEYVELPEPVDVGQVARTLTSIGLEIEGIEQVGHDIENVVIAEVLEIEELTGFKKPIRYCRVTTGGPDAERQVICGAVNFAVSDRVALALPGAKLPGGFEIGMSKRYGRVSDGMICSTDELGLGGDHSGILVLAPDAPLGSDFVRYAGLRDVVLDVNVTPDKGHALSVRGVARELSIAYGAPYTDPAEVGLPAGMDVEEDSYPASIADPAACDRFVLREISGIDPDRATPLPMLVRLVRVGMRSVSLAVDITNYLMLELGQPLHAFDRSKLNGPIVVRRARAAERLETLDHNVRDLDPDDILITDSSGPISLAGTMGGLLTEISDSSTDLVIEAAHFSATGIARMSRRHRLPSEASARFERGVDYELPVRASAKAVAMLAELAGGSIVPGRTLASALVETATITMPADHPDRVAGMAYGQEIVIQRLREVGCEVGQDGETLIVTPPSWRPDLRDPNDLAEEVIRFEGYERIGSRMPRAVAGRGRTAAQRLRARIGRSLAGAGFVEVIGDPFGSADDFERLRLPEDDIRRRAVMIANPIRDAEPLLRTSLLPGLFRVALRNVGRGFADLALFEIGNVARNRDAMPVAPILAVDRAPVPEETELLAAALPDQPRLVSAVLTGVRDPAGWWSAGQPTRQAGLFDAIEAARIVLDAAGLRYMVRASQIAPWHPGRCAEFLLDPAEAADLVGSERPDGGEDGSGASGAARIVLGHAGELHPRVIQAFRLAPRTCAMELDLSAIERASAAIGPVQAPAISRQPVATQDVALVVARDVAAADVEAALAAGAAGAGAGSGVGLEDVQLFDVYTGEQAGPGRKSLAYTLRFRAPDRTLTDAEVSSVRDAAVAEARRVTGAVLRGEAVT